MSIISYFIPQTLANRTALRTAIAVLIAVVTAFSLHFDKPYWAGMTVIMLTNIYAGSVISKAYMRVSGTIIGTCCAALLAHYIINSMLLYYVTIFLIIAFAIYYYNISKYAYAYLLGAISAFITLSQLIGPNPQGVFSIAIWRMAEISVGVLAAAICALCVFPNTAHDNVGRALPTIFDEMGVLLLYLQQVLVQRDTHLLSVILTDMLLLKKKIHKATEIVSFMHSEMGYNRKETDQFSLLLDIFFSGCQTISYFIATNHWDKGGVVTENRVFMHEIFEAAIQDLRALKQAFVTKNTTIILHFSTAIADLNTDERADENDLVNAYFLRQIHHMLIQIKATLMNKVHLSDKKKVITYQAQLRHDMDVILQSIKGGLSAVLALAFWLLADWPGGLNGIVSSLFISLRSNLFEMRSFAVHRLLGCLLGGGLAMFSLTVAPMNLYVLILVIFFGIWVFSYFAFTYIPYSYIGLQANMALVIALAQAGGPPTQIASSLERLGGILIGIVATALVGNMIGRVDLLTTLKNQLGKLQKRLYQNSREVLTKAEVSQVFYELSELFWLCRGLIESLKKGHVSPTKKVKIAQAEKHLEHMVILQATVKQLMHSRHQKERETIHKKLGAPLVALEQAVALLYQPDKKENRLLLQMQIKDASSTLIKQLQHLSLSKVDFENDAMYVYTLYQLALLASPLQNDSRLAVAEDGDQ